MQEVADPGSLVERALVDAALHRPVRLPRLPVAMLSREQKAAELARVQALKAMTAAYEAELVLAWPTTPRTTTTRRPARRVRGRGSPIPSCRGCRSSSPPSWR